MMEYGDANLSVEGVGIKNKAESASRSVIFFDSPSYSYFHHRPFGIEDEKNFMLLDEVVATVPVLLGVAPPQSLKADSSSKLNKVLVPNPFERPHTVFLLEVRGIDGLSLSTKYSNLALGSSFSSAVLGSRKAVIDFSGEEDVSIVHVDEPVCTKDDDSCINKELSELAEWLGGSHTGSLSSHGKLTIPLSSGATIILNITKETERMFATSLASLVGNTRRIARLNEFAQSSIRSSELFVGHLRGLEVFKVENDQRDILELGAQMVEDSVLKLLTMLQTSFGGRVVGVVLSSKDANPNLENMIEVTQLLRVSRSLDEMNADNHTSTEIQQVLLARRTLAWITAIILVVSTLIGIYFLLNMPLTRDTLLYSNVKLD
ncbi:hypothetical protein HPP92_020472 [Vanilla planifolia]|uniref:DUF7794 domain-containing protein n=1 Tax=Vanilla planifolia TaxID=51239 RepID=A0A835UJT6_VANPL|nr:hypothetical protein HPP92_020472 [Vanilla planifolia]